MAELALGVQGSNGKREAGSHNSQSESPRGLSTIAGQAAAVNNDLQGLAAGTGRVPPFSTSLLAQLYG